MEKALCLYVVLLFSGHGLAVSESYGCRTEQVADGSSCSLSESCHSDHPPDQELDQCQDRSLYRQSEVEPNSVRRCNVSGEHFLRCDEVVDHVQFRSDLYFVIKSVDFTVSSLDLRHFALNVSWDYPDAHQALTVPPPDKRLRGYEVRVKQNSTVVDCWCLSEPENFRIQLGLNSILRYSTSSILTVEVLTLPFDPSRPREYYLKFQSRGWPQDCHAMGVVQTSNSCPPPLDASPMYRVESRQTETTTRELSVSWTHSSGIVPSQLYYVYCASKSSNFSVVVNGTQQVIITGLNMSEEYIVRVQGYSHCSGSSAVLSGFSQAIGCGFISDPVSVPPQVTQTTTATTPESTAGPVTSATPLTTTTAAPEAIPLQLPLILTGMAILLLLLLTPMSILLCVVIYRCYHPGSHSDRFPTIVLPRLDPHTPKNLPSKPLKADILVLYSLETPKSEQELIEQCLVARLKLDYVVNSCNDHTDKTIMQWVEEQARHAHLVLIVCSKSFYSDWNSQHRSPLLNSLATIIHSSVKRGNINSKYATVFLESGLEHCIPDNEYLKGMRRFVVGENNSLDDVYAFLKCGSKSYDHAFKA